MFSYFFIILAFVLIGVAILAKIFVIVFAEHDYWTNEAKQFTKEDVIVAPTRGNIFSADGKLMASSLPEYELYLDFKAGGTKKDSILKAELKTISEGLHRIFPNKSASYFRERIKAGKKAQSRYFKIYPGKASYLDYKEVCKLPIFNLSQNAGGFIPVPDNTRKQPFGSLASRTLGAMYAKVDSARSGLEYTFDEQLRGTPGKVHRQKVRNEYIDFYDIPAVNGCDLVTTLDVEIQDIAEKALRMKLEEIEAELGMAVVMDVKTGDVKAIANLTRGKSGRYYEEQNNAVSNLLEPGSTFKTASMMVALEDGKVTPDTKIDTKNGIVMMGGRPMKDWNWHKGGYGEITATEALMYSSNVGVSLIINEAYGKDKRHKQQFVDGLKRLGITEQLKLQITGSPKPNVKGPEDGKDFQGTTLPWMSIGYETQIPPINILTFYNAIANDGKMMKPRFATALVKGDEVVERFPTEVIREKICSDRTLKQIRMMLREVVANGTGKPAGCKLFETAGKTGTAQLNYGRGERVGHLVSFCGYFPADNPKYSCIVSIKNPHKGYPSGGGMSGAVFARIAERVYARGLRLDYREARDSNSVMIPDVKTGFERETRYLLDKLDIDHEMKRLEDEHEGLCWTTANHQNGQLTLEEKTASDRLVPNVRGMGARDAVFLLEQKGLNVHLEGVGKVKKQSIGPGNVIHKGQTILLTLGN